MVSDKLKKILLSSSLPSYQELFDLAEQFSDVLEKEITDYRCQADFSEDGEIKPGSLLDFQNNPLPLIVVPDLHARPKFLLNILNYKLDNDVSVWELLEKGKIRIICVGDALHSERNRMRWYFANNEFKNDDFSGPSMTEEMTEGLALICGIMKLKLMFPKNFHFLKGNHENILNITGDGDYSFKKYADEGEMVMKFIKNYYGEDILYILHCAEYALPLIAVSPGCVISHAEPLIGYSKNELINARTNPNVILGLTWTDNGSAENGSVNKIIGQLAKDGVGKDFVYLAGHRPVTNNYNLRQNGVFVQLHNPGKQNVAIVNGKCRFNPETDIINVNNENAIC